MASGRGGRYRGRGTGYGVQWRDIFANVFRCYFEEYRRSSERDRRDFVRGCVKEYMVRFSAYRSELLRCRLRRRRILLAVKTVTYRVSRVARIIRRAGCETRL